MEGDRKNRYLFLQLLHKLVTKTYRSAVKSISFSITTAYILLQTEWEKRTARISYNLERRFTHAQEDAETPRAQEKAAILRLHLLERTPVSDLCDQYDIHPTMFYRWQKELFENAAAALEPRSRRRQ